MADQEFSTEQALAMLRAGQASPSAAAVETPSSPFVPGTSPLTAALATGTGGLINLGDLLTFGQLSKGIAAVPAIGRDLYGLATGAAPQDYYTEELAKVNALKNLYAQQRDATGIASDAETALSFMAPVPGGKAQKLTELVPALKSAGLGLTSYLGSEIGDATTDSPYGSLAGALLAPASVSGVKALAKVAAPALEDTGKGLQRFSMGLRQSDLTKKGNALLETGIDSEGNVIRKTQVTKSFDNLIENNTLGQSRDPNVLYENAINAKDDIEREIQKKIREVDKSGVKIEMPSFSNAEKYLKNNRVDVTEIKNYEKIIDDFKAAIKNESKFVEPDFPVLYDEFGKVIPKTEFTGMSKAVEEWKKVNAQRSRLSLDVINKQKKVFGEKYREGPQADPGFWRAFYKDLKTHIERYAPDVQQLNKKKQDLVVAEPILLRNKKAAEKPMTAQDVKRAMLWTTGGGGLPGAAFLTGSPVLGALLAGGLALAGTKQGQNLTGRAFGAVGGYGSGMQQSLPEILTQLGMRGYLAGIDSQEPELSTEEALKRIRK